MRWMLLLHLLCFVYWLGADLGTFYAARFVADARLSTAARATAARIMHGVDLLPRLAMPLTLASGAQLAAMMGLLPLGAPALVVVWALCGVWLLVAAWLHLAPRTARVERVVRADFVARCLVAIALAASAVAFGVGGQLAPMLALKILCFAFTVACGLAIRTALKPFGPAFGALMTQGSTPEVEAVLAGSIARAVPWVLAIWALLVLAAALGVRAIVV